MTNIVTLTLNPTIDRSARIEHVLAEYKLRCSVGNVWLMRPDSVSPAAVRR